MPVAAKVCKNTFAAESCRFAKTKSINQRKVSFLLHALRRQFGGFLLSPSKCKRCTAYYIFSLADVCGCRGVGFMLFFGFCSFFFSLHITLSQVVILSRFYKFVCEMKADVSAAGTYSCSLPPLRVRRGCSVTLLCFARGLSLLFHVKHFNFFR